jgi:hypothetical protein
MRFAMAAAALLAGTATLQAQEGFLQGAYFSAPEACALAREGGTTSAIEEGHLLLTATGILGYEYHCDFVETHKARHGPNWLAAALCEEPGVAFPDLLAIAPRAEGSVEVSSLAERGGETGGTTTYILCEGVEAP